MSKPNFQSTKVDSSKPLTQRAGDSIERVGNKLAKDSSPRQGDKAGQKIESPSDKRRY